MKDPSSEMIPEMENSEDIASDMNEEVANSSDEDDMPEEIGLTTSRQLASKQEQAIKESLETKKSIKKEKRKQLEIKIKNQKNKKLRKEKRKEEAISRKKAKESPAAAAEEDHKVPPIKNALSLVKLPEELLAEVSDTPVGGDDAASVISGELGLQASNPANNKIIFSDNEDDDLASLDEDDSLAGESIYSKDSGYSDHKKQKKKPSKLQAVNLHKLSVPQMSDDVAKFLASRFSGSGHAGKRFRRAQAEQVVDTRNSKSRKFQTPKLPAALRVYEKERDGLIKRKKIVVTNTHSKNKSRLK